jgi:hypothetical protein
MMTDIALSYGVRPGGRPIMHLRRSRVYDHFACRPAEKDFQLIQHIAAQDTLLPNEIGVQPARIFFPIDVNPNGELQCCCARPSYTAYPPRPSLIRGELQLLAVGPGERAGVGSGVGNDAGQSNTW